MPICSFSVRSGTSSIALSYRAYAIVIYRQPLKYPVACPRSIVQLLLTPSYRIPQTTSHPVPFIGIEMHLRSHGCWLVVVECRLTRAVLILRIQKLSEMPSQIPKGARRLLPALSGNSWRLPLSKLRIRGQRADAGGEGRRRRQEREYTPVLCGNVVSSY